MTAEPRSTRLGTLPALARGICIPIALVWMSFAHAQPVDGIVGRSGFADLIARLGSATLALIAAAVVIVALLIWRVMVMVRRERPTPVPPTRGPRRSGEDALDRASIQRETDWGFDQNKRAALARSPVAVTNTTIELPSLDAAASMWSTTDLNNANSAGVQPADALGQSPFASASAYRTSSNPYFKREKPAERMPVEEVADTLLQAELLVQLGDPKQAMTLLSHHIRDTEKPGPAVWLMLLNLYQSTGREAQYNALSAGFRMLFNAELPPWAESSEQAARDLESYPQVIQRLQAGWSGPQAQAVVENLLNDDRGGSRQGFSIGAYRELLFLSEILATLDAIDREEEERQGIQRKLGAVPY